MNTFCNNTYRKLLLFILYIIHLFPHYFQVIYEFHRPFSVNSTFTDIPSPSPPARRCKKVKLQTCHKVTGTETETKLKKVPKRLDKFLTSPMLNDPGDGQWLLKSHDYNRNNRSSRLTRRISIRSKISVKESSQFSRKENISAKLI